MIRFAFRPALWAICSLLLLSSCQKLMDFLPSQPNQDYRIKSIVYGENISGTSKASFYYNKWNNPDSVIFTIVGTGRPNFQFIYNKKKEIREIKEGYLNGQYEKWHRLGLNNKGQIVVDTVYIFGYLNQDPEPSNFWNKRIERFEYDSYGRMSKMSYEFVVPYYPTSSTIINYSSTGNLIYPFGTPVYDNYRNPLTLHPLWQFLQKDYSVNNPIPALTYNSFRLPLQFNQGAGDKFAFLSGRYLDQSFITYETK